MTSRLIWSGSFDKIPVHLGGAFLTVTAQGARKLVVTLNASPAAESLMRDAAQTEGRTGWSSSVLVQAIWQLAADAAKGAKRERPCSVRMVSDILHVYVDPPEVLRMAQSLEDAQIEVVKASDEEHEKGHRAAEALIEFLGNAHLKDVYHRGYDTRWATLSKLAELIGTKSGLGTPKLIRSTRFETRNGPDEEALATWDKLALVTRTLMVQLRAVAPDLQLALMPVARVNPDAQTYTAVIVHLTIPGVQEFYAAWPANAPRS